MRAAALGAPVRGAGCAAAAGRRLRVAPRAQPPRARPQPAPRAGRGRAVRAVALLDYVASVSDDGVLRLPARTELDPDEIRSVFGYTRCARARGGCWSWGGGHDRRRAGRARRRVPYRPARRVRLHAMQPRAAAAPHAEECTQLAAAGPHARAPQRRHAAPSARLARSRAQPLRTPPPPTPPPPHPPPPPTPPPNPPSHPPPNPPPHPHPTPPHPAPTPGK
jgi:hypothetical protein